MLDFATCDAARLRRDPAYDGEFFIAVRTTRIYCRPICPVRAPLSKNIAFYPSAAAAERAGFRPCLRCRPETAPFCPAWRGTRTTVERALRLIEEGALDRGSVEALAARLGVGARHLSRLFGRHLGASPLRVAATQRVARARTLLDAGAVDLEVVAHEAGFGSVRRMKAALLALYGPHAGAMTDRAERAPLVTGGGGRHGRTVDESRAEKQESGDETFSRAVRRGSGRNSHRAR